MKHRGLNRRQLLGTIGMASVAGNLHWLQPACAAESYTLRMTFPTNAESLFGVTSLRYAAAVRRRTNGRVNIEVYPNGQLARESELIETQISGVLDMAMMAASFMAATFPRYQIFDVPFLFKNIDAGYRVLNGPIGNEFAADLEPKGIVGLSWGATGLKQIETVSKPIVTAADMRGVRMRVQNGGLYLATYQALGAIPVTIDSSEVYTALSQHTVDGADFSIDSFTKPKMYNICKHMAMSNHVFNVCTMTASKKKLEALPLDIQKILREEGKSLATYWRSILKQQSDEDMVILKQNGVQFTEIQFAGFRKAVDPVYSLVQAKLGAELLDRVGRAATA